MSVRHPEFCDIVERLALGQDPPTKADLTLLEDYASPEGVDADQLDGWTFEAVQELTGREDVWSPGRASEALLGTFRD